jgi:membrane protease YdiL (CAAX protease family)
MGVWYAAAGEMRNRQTSLLVLFALCVSHPATFAGAADKQFGCTPSQIQVSGCADITLHGVRPGRDIVMKHRIWFSERTRRYRVDADLSWSGPGDQRSYLIGNGSHAYAALAAPNWPEKRVKWAAMPEAWMHDDLQQTFTRRRIVHNAQLVWTGRCLGLPAQHWRGHRGAGDRKRQEDVWLSTDPRFPAVLRYVNAGRTSTIIWQIKTLDISHPVPGYMFIPLLRPKTGVASLLASHYWPAGYVLFWHVLSLACCVGLALGLAPRKRSPGRRTALALGSGAGVMVLLFWSPRVDAYFSLLSDTWFLLLLGLLSVGAVFASWRAAYGERQLPLFGRLRWPTVLWALFAASVAFLIRFARTATFAGSLGFANWKLPFLPITLLNVTAFAAPNAAVQEFIFRGCLYGWLERRGWSSRAVLVVQALAFSAYHIPRSAVLFGWGAGMAVDLALMFVFGIVFGLLRRRYGGLLAPWLVHFAYNTAFLYVSSASLGGCLAAIQTM